MIIWIRVRIGLGLRLWPEEREDYVGLHNGAKAVAHVKKPVVGRFFLFFYFFFWFSVN